MPKKLVGLGKHFLVKKSGSMSVMYLLLQVSGVTRAPNSKIWGLAGEERSSSKRLAGLSFH